MTPALLALLVHLGKVGAVTVYRLRPGVPRSAAVDAGILIGGVRTTVAVEGRRDLGGGAYQYGSGHVDGVWRSGDSVLIIDPPDNVDVFRPDRARRDDAAGTVASKTLRARPDDCACSSGSNCFEILPDGSQVPARLGITLVEGQWVGAGCVRKTGGVLAGESDWPSSCPERAP